MSSTNSISSEIREAALSAPTEFSSSLGRALFQQKLESILLGTKEATGADGVAVSLKDGDVYVCRASVGCAPDIGVTVESGHGLCGRCVAEAKAVVEQALDGDIKSVAAVPVLKDGSVHGFVAGFSMQANAFAPAAVKDFHHLAALIHNEVEPPIAFELKPETDEADDELLTQLGIRIPAANSQGSLEEEDESFLTELVRDVLQPPTSDDLPVAPTEVQPTEAPPETVAPAYPTRTTEEVLMQVVEQSAPADSKKTPEAPATIVAAPVKSTTMGKSTAAEHKPAPATSKPPAGAPEAKQKHPATEVVDISTKSAQDAWVRPALIVILILALLAAAAWYYRHRRTMSETLPQKVLASAPDKNPAPAATVEANQPVSPDKPPDKQPTRTESRPKSVKPSQPTHRRFPIIVASSNRPHPLGANEEQPPVALSGVEGRIAAPDLPAASTNIIFGGVRSNGAIPAKLIQRVDPTYPSIARSMHLSGDVRMEAAIGSDGRVKSVKTLEGHQILAAAASDAVRRWRYQPALQNGTAVESIVEVTIRFR